MHYAELFAAASLTFYTVCFIPQIIENYQRRSTYGLSEVTLVSYYWAYLAMMYYIFYCHLILPYKIIVPIETVVMSVMIGQKWYYHGFGESKPFWLIFFLVNTGMLLVYPLSLYNTHAFGMGCGWLASIFFVLYPIPQVLKIYQEKSVKGFSFYFLTVQAMAVLCEGIVAVLRQLPMPTLLMIAKGVVFYLIFTFQFWLYQER